METKFHLKKSRTSSYLPLLLIGLALFVMSGCRTFMSVFDQYAYQQTTSLKVDALNVMTLATDSFSRHQQEVALLETNLQKIYEYERNRPKNEISVRMWDLLLKEDGHLLTGFLRRWQQKATLSKAFVDNQKKIVGDAFDQISGLESGKLKAKDVKTE